MSHNENVSYFSDRSSPIGSNKFNMVRHRDITIFKTRERLTENYQMLYHWYLLIGKEPSLQYVHFIREVCPTSKILIHLTKIIGPYTDI